MFCYDGYNQRGHEEVSMTLRSENDGGECNDACPKVAIGFNAELGNHDQQYHEECANPLAVAHKEGVCQQQTLGFKYKQSEKSRAPFAENGEAQALSSQCHDSAVAIKSLLSAMRFIVRRLTPKEAERLMGLPAEYTIPVGLDPDDSALIAEFQRIHDTFGAIMADYAHKKPPKPKSAKQVAAWLAKITDPATCPDSPRYKACGNGWATNQPRWILTRLLAKEGIEW